MELTTLKEAAVKLFFEQVLELKTIKFSKKTHLKDFSQDKRFEKEFVDMFADRCLTRMGFNIKNIKNKPLVEILDYLTIQLSNRSKFGHLPKKSFRRKL